MLSVTFSQGIFVCRCTYENRHVPKKAGFQWDLRKKAWFTPRLGIAIQLKEYFDAAAKDQFSRRSIKIKAWTGSLSYNKKLKLKPFQKEIAIPWALSRNRSYLALDPGLGKSVIAAVIAHTLKTPTVVVSPPVLVKNIHAEFVKWNDEPPEYDYRVATWESYLGFSHPVRNLVRVLIVPDSMIHKPVVQEALEHFTRRTLQSCLIVDEAHRFKNVTAKRTKALLGRAGIRNLFSREVYMSGTPMQNRTIELYPVLASVAPETIGFMTYEQYGKRYCDGKLKEYSYGQYAWDFSGVSNLSELLQNIKKDFMLRLKKADVLKDLPEKTSEMVLIGKRSPKLLKMERQILRQHSPEDLLKAEMPAHLSRYRHELGLLKVKEAAAFIDTILEGSSESLLVFAYHKDVIDGLMDGLQDHKPLLLVGDNSHAEKSEAVKNFQNGKSRLLIANYLAGGLGWTLTKAPRAIMVEYSWVPAENEQAEDRIHRIGQDKNVRIQYLVYQNSLDKTLLDINFKKKKIISQL